MSSFDCQADQSRLAGSRTNAKRNQPSSPSARSRSSSDRFASRRPSWSQCQRSWIVIGNVTSGTVDRWNRAPSMPARSANSHSIEVHPALGTGT